ncbi:putative Ig domain-containing protein [Luteolibacter arcticus]|uniref:Ig domain-containing protein n=1 Tax=Luteolibacter arcticus TaxID=1581411 RepID=A0ABT3GSH8_9BACT|nr:putative Ig domain-containing protein [Luteolibacter arcticus]MCW1926476.1 putative Ig domain-containing protein [Luteolibacter arcticus]
MRFLILFLLALTAIPAFSQGPTVPSNVQATATSGSAVTVTWTASTGTGAITYRVFRNGTQTGTDVSATTFSDTGLTPGTTYSYTVSALNTDGASSQSVAATVTTPNTPGTPTGLRATRGTDQVSLQWNSVSGAIEYVIFRNGTEIDTSTTTTYIDTDIEPATTYRYSVASTNASGDSAKSAEVAVTTKGDGSKREAVWTREFERADGDFDGIVDFDEYLVAFPNKLPEIVMIHRFNSSDDDESGDLTVDEYIAHFAGKTVKRPSKAQAFTLADEFSSIGDADGYLDIYEYALTLNRGTKEAQLTKKFNKADKNDSGFLSPVEFGIRNGRGEEATEITSPLTASGTPGEAFEYEIIATKEPTSYGAVGLPPGLTIDTTTGVISGTPTTVGSYSVTISATDGMGTDTATLTIRIGVPSITSTTIASGSTTASFSYQIIATQTPTAYGAANLPAGLSVNTTTGLISGTPTTAGTSNVVLTATNAAGTGSKVLVLTITAPPSITSALTKSGTTNVAFSYQITATPAATSYTASPLPAGLTFSTTTGLISGTPTVAAVTNVTITATNTGGTDTETLVITISAP